VAPEMGNNMSRVIDGLYVGGMLGADGKEKLKEKGITHVLSIHDTAEPQHPDVCLASILWLGRS